VYLRGAAPGVAARAAAELERRYPGLVVAGCRDGYFREGAEEEALISAVSSAGPDLLFVALDAPRQDAWIHARLGRLGARAAMGVGGSFDVIAGGLKRSPSWMRAAGLEWLYRLAQEPWRFKRMSRLPLFALRVLRPARRVRGARSPGSREEGG
jgi:N-acetylglucosaminyldiphosphoundecaprenol N-acetyl-beta-D-mannosaminyltransferase